MYNKKVLSKATAGLDKAKAPAKKKDIIVDPRGQWKHPGQNTRIPSSNITMQGVNYPVLGVGSNGQQQMMYPGMEYTFPGADYVDEFPQMQNGGSNRTQLSPEEEQQFQNFYQSLPDNLMDDDPSYDIRGYWDSEGRPESFNYDQPKEEDGYYHGYSINSNTGEYLKSPTHPTFQHAVHEDRKIGYRPVTNVYGRNIAIQNESIIPQEQQSFLRNTEGPANYIEADLTDEEIEEYRKGGYIVDDISVSELTKAQKGLVINDPKEFAYRNQMYNDSLNLYKQYANTKKLYTLPYVISKGNVTKPKLKNKDLQSWLNEDFKDAKIKPQSYDVYKDLMTWDLDDPTHGKKHPWVKSPAGTYNWLPNTSGTYNDYMENVYPDDTFANTTVGSVNGSYYIPKYKKPVQPIIKGPNLTGANPLVTMPSGAKLGAKKKVVNDPYAHSKTTVVPTVIGIPPDQNNDPTKKHIGTNEIMGYDENGNPTRRIEYVYEDVKLTKGLKDLSKFTDGVQNEIVPQKLPLQDPKTSNTAFRYRDQWQHVYKPVEGGFETFGTKQATLPYGEKLGEHPWEYNKSNELPESGHHVWIVGNQKYYNEEEAKAAAEQWDKDNSYQFKQGGTLSKAQLGKNVSLTTSPFSLNANAIPLASKVFGEYNPELLLGAKQTLKSPNQDYKHNATVDLGLPYTGKFAPSVNAAYHGAYDLSTPGQKLKPTVNSDLQVGYHPKQGVNFAITANPRLEFSNVGQDTLNRKNWSQGAWKGYVGLLGSVGYRGKSFDPNNIQGVPASWATVDPKGGNFLMGFGANAGFEARPFKKPLKLGIDASLMESHGKKSAEQTVDSSPHNYTGWTPTVNVHASYPLSELMRKKQNKTREPNLPKNRPSGVHKFQEGGKLGPIHLNEGRKTIRDYVYGADIGMLQEQQGGYIDTELTDEEIQAYRDAGYDVEELG